MNQTLVKYNSLFKSAEFSKNRLYLENMINDILMVKDHQEFSDSSIQSTETSNSIKMPSLSKIIKNNNLDQESNTTYF